MGNRQTNVQWKKMKTLNEIDAFSYLKHHHSIKSDKNMASLTLEVLAGKDFLPPKVTKFFNRNIVWKTRLLYSKNEFYFFSTKKKGF